MRQPDIITRASALLDQDQVTTAFEMLADEVMRMRAERLKLDKRIHNQRRAWRDTWEIVEMRQNFMGSKASRAAYGRLLKRFKALSSHGQVTPSKGG